MQAERRRQSEAQPGEKLHAHSADNRAIGLQPGPEAHKVEALVWQRRHPVAWPARECMQRSACSLCVVRTAPLTSAGTSARLCVPPSRWLDMVASDHMQYKDPYATASACKALSSMYAGASTGASRPSTGASPCTSPGFSRPGTAPLRPCATPGMPPPHAGQAPSVHPRAGTAGPARTECTQSPERGSSTPGLHAGAAAPPGLEAAADRELRAPCLGGLHVRGGPEGGGLPGGADRPLAQDESTHQLRKSVRMAAAGTDPAGLRGGPGATGWGGREGDAEGVVGSQLGRTAAGAVSPTSRPLSPLRTSSTQVMQRLRAVSDEWRMSLLVRGAASCRPGALAGICLCAGKAACSTADCVRVPYCMPLCRQGSMWHCRLREGSALQTA